MNRSKLEPGCKAITVHGKINLGKIVKVGNFIGSSCLELGQKFDDLWEVDKLMEYGVVNGNKIIDKISLKLCPGRMLQRIDDDDENTTKPTTEEIEETA